MTPAPKSQMAAAYRTAADHHDAPALSVWDYFRKAYLGLSARVLRMPVVYMLARR
jgi:hypothetical protein